MSTSCEFEPRTRRRALVLDPREGARDDYDTRSGRRLVAVGFGATAMADAPWTVVVEGKNVSERKLADHAAGEVVATSVRVSSNTHYRSAHSGGGSDAPDDRSGRGSLQLFLRGRKSRHYRGRKLGNVRISRQAAFEPSSSARGPTAAWYARRSPNRSDRRPARWCTLRQANPRTSDPVRPRSANPWPHSEY